MAEPDPTKGVLRWTLTKTRGHLRGAVASAFGVPLALGVLAGLLPLGSNPNFADRLANGALLLLLSLGVVGSFIALFVLVIAPYQQRNTLRKTVGERDDIISELRAPVIDALALKEHLRHLQEWSAEQDNTLADGDPLDLNLTPAAAFARHFPNAYGTLLEYNVALTHRVEGWMAIADKAKREANEHLNQRGWEAYKWAAQQAYRRVSPLVPDNCVAVGTDGALIGLAQNGAFIPIRPAVAGETLDEVEGLRQAVLAELRTVVDWPEIEAVRVVDEEIAAARARAVAVLEPIPWQTAIQYDDACLSCPHPAKPRG